MFSRNQLLSRIRNLAFLAFDGIYDKGFEDGFFSGTTNGKKINWITGKVSPIAAPSQMSCANRFSVDVYKEVKGKLDDVTKKLFKKNTPEEVIFEFRERIAEEDCYFAKCPRCGNVICTLSLGDTMRGSRDNDYRRSDLPLFFPLNYSTRARLLGEGKNSFCNRCGQRITFPKHGMAQSDIKLLATGQARCQEGE